MSSVRTSAFLRNVRIDLATGCHLWTGYVGRDGYGRVAGFRAAHRFAWELAGRELPPGLCVLHACDQRLCVNLDHLFLGTKADNAQDMARKGRGRKGNMPYGVSVYGKSFKVRLCLDGSMQTFGIYPSVEQAAAAALRIKIDHYFTSDQGLAA